MYYKFWLGGFDELLQPVPDCNLKYLPEEHIDSLQLDHLSYNESILLVREEYEVTFSYLQSCEEKKRPQRRSAGMVVTGQPGIGMHLLPAALSFANNRLVLQLPIQESPVSYTIFCFAS